MISSSEEGDIVLTSFAATCFVTIVGFFLLFLVLLVSATFMVVLYVIIQCILRTFSRSNLARDFEAGAQIIIDCFIGPYVDSDLDIDLEAGVLQRDQSQQWSAANVTYHPTINRIEERRRKGLRQSDIETLMPKFVFEEQGNNNVEEDDEESESEFVICIRDIFVEEEDNNKEEEEEEEGCVICVCEFVVNEECRVFPVCGHVYHVSCIDAWLRNHRTCPTCRFVI